jgi:putative addiction module component (TIGR02574 family)
MNDHVKNLFTEARKLSPEEREELADMLLDSLPPTAMEEAWSKEAQQRWDDHVASGADTVDALEAVEEARLQLRRASR